MDEKVCELFEAVRAKAICQSVPFSEAKLEAVLFRLSAGQHNQFYVGYHTVLSMEIDFVYAEWPLNAALCTIGKFEDTKIYSVTLLELTEAYEPKELVSLFSSSSMKIGSWSISSFVDEMHEADKIEYIYDQLMGFWIARYDARYN